MPSCCPCCRGQLCAASLLPLAPPPRPERSSGKPPRQEQAAPLGLLRERKAAALAPGLAWLTLGSRPGAGRARGEGRPWPPWARSARSGAARPACWPAPGGGAGAAGSGQGAGTVAEVEARSWSSLLAISPPAATL